MVAMFGGALAQAVGIWGMHFTGMLAFTLPVPVAYVLGLMLLSYVVAFAGSLLALLLTQRRSIRTAWLIVGALAIGAGISGSLHRHGSNAHGGGHEVFGDAGVRVDSHRQWVWAAQSLARTPPQTRRSSTIPPDSVGERRDHGRCHRRHALHGDVGRSLLSRPGHAPIGAVVHRAASGSARVVVLSTLAILAVALFAASSDRRRSAGTCLAADPGGTRGRTPTDSTTPSRRSWPMLTALRLNLQRFSPREDASLVGDSISLVDESLERVARSRWSCALQCWTTSDWLPQ